MPPGPPTAPPAILIRNARLRFGDRLLFDGLGATIEAGRTTCLLGPSGVGKSTLLRLAAGLAAPEPPTRVEASDGQPLQGRTAWMGQQDLLMPWLSVLDNVLVGSRLRGERPDRDRAMNLLAEVGLADRALDRPAALSGGMRQRAALARTLMEDRPVVLMDEPFSSLDALTRLTLQDMAGRLLAGRTVLLVTHDPLEALRLADRVLILEGSPAELSEFPAPAAATPRRVADPALLAAQGALLARLGVGAAP
ncbi:MAG TPA: ATP-binding cassette domain-containing protein [Azospirillaceae bacterium]|nr:ATP-binding cassette domain-containing protein [Azospirillaceae bacterium]